MQTFPNQMDKLATEQSEQKVAPESATSGSSSVPSTGRRLIFQDIKRQLTPEELANSGTQKVILDVLITTEAERDELRGFVDKYYQAEIRARVAAEQLKTNKANEILFGVGVGVGGAIIGLAPFFWDTKADGHQGEIALVVGLLLVVGATLGRIINK